MTFWAILPRWAKIVALGVVLAAGAGFWVYRRGVADGQLRERLKADEQAVAAAARFRLEKGQAVAAAYRQGAAAIRTANALHDSVHVVDTVTLLLPGPTLTPTKVVVPAIVVRRIVSDSLAMMAKDRIIVSQAALIVSDTAAIVSLQRENATLRSMKTPKCGGKCKAAATVATFAVAAEAVVRIVSALKR